MRYVAVASMIVAGLIVFAIQPGFPLTDDITGEDDGSLIQGLLILLPSTAIGWWALRHHTERAIRALCVWSSLGLAFWSFYSAHHFYRWQLYGSGDLLLLLPEGLVVLYATAAATSLSLVIRDRGAHRRLKPPAY